MNRRVPDGTHGGVRGRKSPLETFSYSIVAYFNCTAFGWCEFYRLTVFRSAAFSQERTVSKPWQRCFFEALRHTEEKSIGQEQIVAFCSSTHIAFGRASSLS